MGAAPGNSTVISCACPISRMSAARSTLIARVRDSCLAQQVAALFLHILEKAADRGPVQGPRARSSGSDEVERERRGQQSDGAADTGAERSDDLPDAELFRYAVGMYGARAAEGKERKSTRIPAALHGVYASRVGHVLIDDLVHGPGGAGEVQPEWVGQSVADGAFGRGYVERHTPTQKVARVQVAENHVGVCNGRLRAAQAVAGPPRLRAGGIRAHLEQPKTIDAGDAATTCSDLDQVDAADLDRVAQSLS